MTASDVKLMRTLKRRETHRSRSVSIAVVLLVLVVAAAYAGTECALAALRMRALLVSPTAAMTAWAAGSPVVLAVAAVAAVVGVIAVVLAVTPARRPRHAVTDARAVILLDDDLLASAMSQAVARRTGVALSQTRTAIGRRSATVDVTRTSGVPLSAADVRGYADALVAELELRPTVRVSARISASGVVGA